MGETRRHFLSIAEVGLASAALVVALVGVPAQVARAADGCIVPPFARTSAEFVGQVAAGGGFDVGEGLWSEPSNWLGGATPATDSLCGVTFSVPDVTIPAGKRAVAASSVTAPATVTVQGELDINAPFSVSRYADTFSGSGSLTVEDGGLVTASNYVTAAQFTGTGAMEFTGGGIWFPTSGTSTIGPDLNVAVPSGGSMIIGAPGGNVDAVLANEGSIIAAGGTFSTGSGVLTIRNDGTMEAIDGGFVRLYNPQSAPNGVTVENAGTLRASGAGSRLWLGEASRSGDLAELNNTNTGLIEVLEADLKIGANAWASDGSIEATGSSVALGGNYAAATAGGITRTNSPLTLNGSIDNTGGFTIDNSAGVVTLNDVTIDGEIDATGGSPTFGTALPTLAGVTWRGPLETGRTVLVGGNGITFDPPDPGGKSAVTLAGGTLQVLPADTSARAVIGGSADVTLDNGAINFYGASVSEPDVTYTTSGASALGGAAQDGLPREPDYTVQVGGTITINGGSTNIGQGKAAQSFELEGDVDVRAGSVLTLYPETVTTSATTTVGDGALARALRPRDVANVDAGVAWTNTGTLVLEPGATMEVRRGQQYVDQPVTFLNAGGATWNVPSGATVEASPQTNAGGALNEEDPLINRGTLNLGGEIRGTLINEGTLAPGASPGIATISRGDLTLASSSVLEMEIEGSEPGTGYDQVVVSGQANLGGQLSVTVGSGSTPTSQTFDIIDAGSTVGDFASVTGLPSYLTYSGGQLISSPTPGLAVSLLDLDEVDVDDDGVLEVGEGVVLTAVVENSGSTVLTNVVADIIDGLFDEPKRGTPGPPCSVTADGYACAIGDLDIGERHTLEVEFTVARAGSTSVAVEAAADGDVNSGRSTPIDVVVLPNGPDIDPIDDTTIDEDSDLSVAVNVTYGGSDQVELTLTTGPSGAALDGSTIRWTPPMDTTPQGVAFEVTASAGGRTTTQAFLVDVAAVDDPPVLGNNGPFKVVAGEALDISLDASDVDSDQLIWATSGNVPEGLTLSSEGRLQWTPLATQVGPATISVTVADEATAVPGDVSITVSPAVPPAPGVDLEVSAEVQRFSPFDTGPTFLNEVESIAVTVTNNGPDNLPGKVQLNVTAASALIDGSTTADCSAVVPSATDGVLCTIDALPAGESTTVIAGIIPESTGPFDVLASWSTIPSEPVFDDSDATNNTDAVALNPVLRRADLSVSTVVLAGAGLDGKVPSLSGYTVRVAVTNDGPHDAEVALALEYPLTVVTPVAKPSECDLLTLSCSFGLPAGVTRTIDVEFGPRTNLALNPIEHVATVSSSNAADGQASNNTSTLSVSFRPRAADLAVTQIVSLSNAGEVVPGEIGAYEVRFSNIGPDDSANPVLELRYQDAAPSPLPLGCSPLVVTAPYDGGLTCDLSALDAGTSGQLYVDLQFFGPNSQPSVLEATIVDPDDPASGNNTAQVTTLVLADSDGDGVPDRDDIFSGPSVTAGEPIVINATGFESLEPIKLFLFSDPVLLGEGTADGQGVVSLDVTIPLDTPAGQHTLELRGKTGRTLSTPITVLAGADPLKCTITGTDGRDFLVGTPGEDVICAGKGDDFLLGLSGDDILIGGPGRDVLVGGRGNDVLIGGSGKDLLLGGVGSDTLCWAGDCR